MSSSSTAEDDYSVAGYGSGYTSADENDVREEKRKIETKYALHGKEVDWAFAKIDEKVERRLRQLVFIKHVASSCELLKQEDSFARYIRGASAQFGTDSYLLDTIFKTLKASPKKTRLASTLCQFQEFRDLEIKGGFNSLSGNFLTVIFSTIKMTNDLKVNWLEMLVHPNKESIDRVFALINEAPVVNSLLRLFKSQTEAKGKQ